jgi:hypothetical protein
VTRRVAAIGSTKEALGKKENMSPVHQLSDVEARGMRLHEQHQVLCATLSEFCLKISNTVAVLQTPDQQT